jgi:hypothetical protein
MAFFSCLVRFCTLHALANSASEVSEVGREAMLIFAFLIVCCTLLELFMVGCQM